MGDDARGGARHPQALDPGLLERRLLRIVPSETASEASVESVQERHWQPAPENFSGGPAARPGRPLSEHLSGFSIEFASPPSGIEAPPGASPDAGGLHAFLPGSAPSGAALREPDVHGTAQSGQSPQPRRGYQSPDRVLAPGPFPAPSPPCPSESSSAFLTAVCSMVQAHDADMQRLQEENSKLRSQLEDGSRTRTGRLHSYHSAGARRRSAILSRFGALLHERLQTSRAIAPHDHGSRVVTQTISELSSLNHDGLRRQTSFSGSVVGAAAGEFRVKAPWNRPPHTPRPSLTRQMSFSQVVSLPSQNTSFTRQVRQNFILHPDSGKRLAWDLICSLLLLYDVVAIPFVYGFDLEASAIVSNVAVGALCCWSVDIFMSMITGYHSGTRNVVMAPKEIVLRYLRTWALFDVCIVSMDAALLFAESGSISTYFRALRASRFMRPMRLLRVLKFRRVTQHVQDKFTTESSSICFGVTLILICLILANHVVACLWYAVGHWEHADTSWVIVHDMESKSILYRYCTSLHWSLTLFTPASMEVTPTNAMERCFAVVALLFAMLTFSSFISILTASITQLRNLRNVEAKQFWMLKRYLKDWSVSADLRGRIIHHCEFAYEASHRRVQEADVALLSLLSAQMERDLKYETFSMHLRVHGFWHSCGSDARFFAKALASHLVGRYELAFACGDVGREVVFCADGCLQYTRGPNRDSDFTSDWLSGDEAEAEGACASCWEHRVHPVPLQAGDWAAEPVLWTHWTHVGDLNSQSECQLIAVDSSKFGSCFSNLSSARGIALAYAAAFVKRLNEVSEEQLSDLTAETIDPWMLVEEGDPGAKAVQQSGEHPSGGGGVRAAATKFSLRLARCGGRH